MNNLTIRSKILAAAILLSAASIVLGFYNLRQTGLVNEKAAEIRDNWLPSVARLGALNTIVKTVRARQNRLSAYLAYFPDKVAEGQKQVRDTIAEADKAHEAYKPFITPNSREAALARDFATAWDALKQMHTKAEALIEQKKFPEASAVLIIESTPTALLVDKVLAESMAYNEAEGMKAANAARDVYNQAVLLTLIAIGLAVVLGAGVSVLLVRGVVQPLAKSTATVEALASGNTDVTVEGAERGDELGVLARALDTFKNGMIRQRLMEREADEARVRAEEERIAAQEEAIAKERELVAGSIGAGMAELAARNLTYRLTDRLPQAYEKMQRDFNGALEALEKAMQGVSASANAISGGTQEIAVAADDLSRRTEQQAASLEETAAAIDEITETGKKAAEGALHARDVVARAKEDAEKAGEVVRRTVESMGSIEASSQQINQIIVVIDEIAFQTNLLALNAGVEAARAGEAGRGFAVVASEVRALAQRSAEAAKEIKSLISTSSAQVADGVSLVSETGTALQRILEQVSGINGVVTNIATGAQEQANGLGEINLAINQMDQVTQQNAAMVEETTAAGHSLAEEARKLAELIAQFRIHGGTGARSEPRRAAPASRPAPRPAQVRASAAVAVKAAAEPSTDWEDF